MVSLWLITTFLILLNVVLLWATQEPPNLIEVKRRYQILVDYIRENQDVVPEKFRVLENQVVITGRKGGDLGYNVNKGFEIGICLDGSPNDMFHVLLHELAHSTVKEYTHSEQFWKNFGELKDISVELGIYQRIPQRKKFCGEYIQD
jgi:hypothetical protein